MVALANLVTMTTTLSALGDVVHRLFSPLRRLGLPVGILEAAIPLVIRFVPTLIGKARALMQAWRARSHRRANWNIVLPLALLALDDAAFRARFSGSPIKRIGRDRMVRNVLYAIGNSGLAHLRPVAARLLNDPDPTVADAAMWAYERLP